MQYCLVRKGLVVGILVMLVVISIVPSISGIISKSSNIQNIDYEIRTIDSLNADEPKYFDLYELVDFGQTAWGLTSDDFDNDDNIDFAVSSATSPITKSKITIFYNDGNAEFTQDDVFNFGAYINDLGSGDFDNDDDIDLIFSFGGGDHGYVCMLFNDGSNHFGDKTTIVKHGNPGDPEKRINPHFTSADYDMDGDIDLLVGDNSGMVEFYLNDGTAEFTSAGIIHDWGSLSWGITSADFDNDDDIDFIVTAYEENGFGTYAYLKQNTGLPTCFEPGPGEKISNNNIVGCLASLDCDNDGDMDFLTGSSSVHVYLNEYESYYRFLICELFTPGGYYDDLRGGGLTSADYNNDGWGDFVSGGVQGIVMLFLNNHEQVPPENPEINGPQDGKVGIEYQYSFYAADLNKDDVYLYIDWGDGNKEKWIGPYKLGDEVLVNHTWGKSRPFIPYFIRAKARDEHGNEGEWDTLWVSMPRNRAYSNTLLLRLLEQFPILQKLLLLIK